MPPKSKLSASKLSREGYRLNARNAIAQISNAYTNRSSVRPDPADLEEYANRLIHYEAEIVELDQKVTELCDEGDEQTETVDALNFRETIWAAHCQIKRMLKEMENANQPQPDDVQSAAGSTQSHGFKSNLRLPKFELPTFDGDPIAFPEFWDMFEATVHNSPDLSDVEKLRYLKRALTGEAARLAVSYRLTNPMYQELVDKLKERFGKSDFAVNSHLQQLWALQPASRETKSLQFVFDECDRHVRSLNALGLSEAEFGKVYAPVILAKMPWSIRKEVSKQNKSQLWTMSSLRDALRDEIEARQMADKASDSNSSERNLKPTRPSSSNQRPKPASASSLASQSVDHGKGEAKRPNPPCAFCEGDHFSDMCRKYAKPPERKQVAIDKRLCFKCLRANHASAKCRRTKPCFYCSKNWHHSSLCLNRYEKKTTGMLASDDRQDTEDSEPETQPPDQTLTSNVVLANVRKAYVYMQMATVQLKGRGSKSVTARILFDSGSTCSYVTSRLQRALQLETTGYFKLANARFEDSERKVKSYPCVSLSLPVVDGTENVPLSLFVTDQISCGIQKQPLDVKSHPVLRNLKLADSLAEKLEFHEVDILIGGDHYFDIVLDNQIRLKDGLVLLDSKLGFIPTGCVRNPKACEASANLFVSCFLNSAPTSALHANSFDRFWKLEEIGIKEDPITADDDAAVAQFEKSVKEVNGRLTVSWPYKSKEQIPPENRELSLARLKHLTKRIGGKDEVMSAYDEVIRDQWKKGIIEEVPDESKRDGPTTYLPHHEVIRTDHATTKLRIVYDGSAKRNRNEPSLNECLMRGPVLLSDLCGLLIRFRTHAVAFTADIEKAYLQVGLHKQDRDVTRFFWLRDLKQPPMPENLVVYRFTRVLFGIISSAFLLDAAVRYKMRKVGTKVALAVAENTYVDNLATGTSNDPNAIDFFAEAAKLFEEISMNLRAWRTNSDKLAAVIPQEKQASPTDSKILGLTWDTERDELGFQLPQISQLSASTKRSLLQAISKLFDPCGFLAPVCIRAKMLVQTPWKENLKWDERVPESTQSAWHELRTEIDQAAEIKIPRYLGIPDESFELHAFCDASAKAFAAVVYIRSSKYPYRTKLLMSKARLAPIKTVTIPRLELIAVTVGSRLLAFVGKQLQNAPLKSYIWSDSKCVLHWLQSVKVLSVFVENRVKEILEAGFECRYVPTDVNPADLPTKGMSAGELKGSNLWWYGPRFLEGDASTWPTSDITDHISGDQPNEETVAEVKLNVDTEGIPNEALPLGFDPKRFSTLESLCGATAWALRFCENLKTAKLKTPRNNSKWLLMQERHDALLLWIKRVQLSIVHGDPKKWRNIKKKLGVFEDVKGLWRCGGRMRNAELTDDAKFPILLPKNHDFTRLVIWHAHSQAMHMGPEHTLAQLRTKFWIPHAKSQVKSVVHSCNWCRIWEGSEYRLPNVAPLPAFRATYAPPFRSIGVDYLGPVLVVNGEVIGKAWICLFTCAVTRAVHLEAVNGLSADQFLLCFRKFRALCGSPTLIVSDNAKYFKLAQKVLQNSNDETARVEWKYIPEFSPWMGGFYERLVGSVKRCLKKLLGKKTVSLQVLQALVYEIAALINTRPLTFSNDVHDQMLTPAHLLGREVGISKLLDFEPTNWPDSTSANLLEMHAQRAEIIHAFWSLWRKDYLTSLRTTHKEHKTVRGSRCSVPKVGAVVMVKDENRSRVTWPIAVIQRLHESSDGAVRSVTLRLSNGVLRVRPVNKVVPLEAERGDAARLLARVSGTAGPLDRAASNNGVGVAVGSHSMVTVAIHGREALGPYYSNLRIYVDYGWVTSIEQSLWYIILQQHGLWDQAQNMKDHPGLRRDIAGVMSWVKAFDFVIEPFWLFKMDQIYKAIMTYLVRARNNAFFLEFVDISNRYPGEKVNFLLCSGNKDFVFTCGVRKADALAGERLGLNIYGKCLSSIYQLFTQGDLSGIPQMDYFSGHFLQADGYFPHSALIMMDSMGKHVRRVYNGKVIKKGGAWYRDLARVAVQKFVNVRDYRFLVIACGVNPANKNSPSAWRQSLADLLEFIQPAINTAATIIFSTPIYTTKAPYVRKHGDWLCKQVTGIPNAVVVDWSRRYDNIFVASGGSPNMAMLAEDQFHVNRRGFAKLWASWAKACPELGLIPYEWSEMPYLSDGE